MTVSSWLNFGGPAPPWRGSAAGRKFLAPRYYGQRACVCVSPSAFFINYLFKQRPTSCCEQIVLVFWITIVLVLVLWKRRPIILVLVLIFVTKITLAKSQTHKLVDCQPDSTITLRKQQEQIINLFSYEDIYNDWPVEWGWYKTFVIHTEA